MKKNLCTLIITLAGPALLLNSDLYGQACGWRNASQAAAEEMVKSGENMLAEDLVADIDITVTVTPTTTGGIWGELGVSQQTLSDQINASEANNAKVTDWAENNPAVENANGYIKFSDGSGARFVEGSLEPLSAEDVSDAEAGGQDFAEYEGPAFEEV